MKRAGLSVVFLAALGVASAGCAQVLGIEDWEPQATGGGGTGAAGGGGDPSAGGGGTDANGPASSSTATGNQQPICGGGPSDPCPCSVCDNVTKTCKADCTNGSKDFDETDVDCGGPSCRRCDIGASCQRNCDCASKQCVLGQCAVVGGTPSPCENSCGTED